MLPALVEVAACLRRTLVLYTCIQQMIKHPTELRGAFFY